MRFNNSFCIQCHSNVFWECFLDRQIDVCRFSFVAPIDKLSITRVKTRTYIREKIAFKIKNKTE